MKSDDSTTRDSPPVLIRSLARGDEGVLQGFNDQLSLHTREIFLPHAYDRATLSQVIERAVQGIDYACLMVADDRAVGYGFLWDIGDEVPVLGIGLADVWQGRGLGRRLMAHLIDAAWAAGCAGIELTTVPENERAYALYEKVGFIYQRETDNIAGDGRVVRERVMFLPLKPGAQPTHRSFGPPV